MGQAYAWATYEKVVYQMTWNEVLFYAENLPVELKAGIVIPPEEIGGSHNLGKLKMGIVKIG